MSIQLHPASVHFPIAFLLLASVAGLLYLHWQQDEVLRILTWWPLRLGWLATGVAILTGLLAQSGLPPQAPYRATLNWHISTGLALWVLYGTVLYRQWLQGKRRRRAGRTTEQPIQEPDLLNDPRARGWLTILLILGLLLTLASGWNGGRLVYLWGINVAGP